MNNSSKPEEIFKLQQETRSNCHDEVVIVHDNSVRLVLPVRYPGRKIFFWVQPLLCGWLDRQPVDYPSFRPSECGCQGPPSVARRYSFSPHRSRSDAKLTVQIGQSGTIKGTPINSFNSLQGSSPSDWDDTVLNRLDTFMVKAHSYGIKLLISIHSYNALEAANDFYGQWYGTGDFYTDSNAIEYFKERIAHVLAHVNPANGKTWSQSSEYIFAFEAQNEAMHDQV